jgi:Peptidase_C39 like family
VRLPLDIELDVTMRRQPDETTCGPTCLHAVYDYYEDSIALEQVIDEIHEIETGGTYAPFLGTHALQRGYVATLYTWDLRIFDPTWFAAGAPPLVDRLNRQAELKTESKVRVACRAYREFIEHGGSIRLRDLTAPFVRGVLRRGVPMLAGLSSTYLYRMSREFGPDDKPDDLRGEPAGHFVVLSGYHRQHRLVRVSDPYRSNPVSSELHYWVNINRLISSVLLGNLTFDANVLLITRKNGASAL